MKISRLFLAVLALAAAGFGVVNIAGCADNPAQKAPGIPQNGGRLVSTYRTEPASFNRYAGDGVAEDLVARLVHATLVRLDRTTGKIEPRLASEWSGSPDGLTWTFKLREGVSFSDGAPFTSTDVVFSFQALYNPKLQSDLADSLRIDGKPMTARALDPHTVVVVFPAPYGPGVGLLDSLPILPEHKLRAALDAGRFRDAWAVTAPLSEIAGLGPFVIKEYVQGQRMTFTRNPKFWGRDRDGRALPYLDELHLQFTPDQNTEVVRLQAGETDLVTDNVRFEDYSALQALSSRGQIALHEAGVSISPDVLFFNLDPASASAREKPWIQRDEFRHAISQAVDRKEVVNKIFLGQAVEIAGPITPGHGDWYLADLPKPPFDPAQAATRLAAIGLADRDKDGLLDDARGKPVAFSILTKKGNTIRERTAAIVAEHLRKIGVTVNVVALDQKSMLDKWSAHDYDAILFAIEFDAFDPGRNPEFWLSSGLFHFWRQKQASPGTPWEAQMDSLMRKQTTSVNPQERRAIFSQQQRILLDHEPAIYFAAPKKTVATAARVGGLRPSVLSPMVLWDAEHLYTTGPPAGTRR